MLYREVGQSGLRASVISLGSWAIGGGSWWGENDDSESIRAIHAALANGINLIDTAPVYGFGHSEEVVGKAIKEKREEYLISTKGGLRWTGEPGSYYFSRDGRDVSKNLSKKAIKEDVEMSLQRLQTEYIDIYFTHWQSVEPHFTPIVETMEALTELKREGKIRAIGASNVSPEQIEDYLRYGQLDIIQEKYSILDRRIEAELLPLTKERGITFQAYSPLEQGLLTGKRTKDYKPEQGSARDGKKWYKPENLSQIVDVVDGWKDLCDKYGCEQTHLVVAWLLSQGDHVNVLCGARKVEQIKDNVKGVEIALEESDVARMRKEVEGLSLV